MSRQGSLEVRIDELVSASARRFDQHKTPCADLAGHPGGDAVARDRPRVGQRVGFAQPSIGREHRDTDRASSATADLARFRDDHAARQPCRDEMRVLVHGQHRHPVRRIIGEMEIAIHLAHGIGERSSSRHDQQPPRPRGRADRCERGVEELGVRQQRAAQLDDRVDHCPGCAFT